MSMDAEFNSYCPICLDTWDNVAYTMPCLHQFCFSCILHWMESKANCPLCKRCVSSIVHSVGADDEFSEVVITPTAEPSVISQQAGRAHGYMDAHIPHWPTAAQTRAAQPVPRAAVGGLRPSIWASIFRDHPEILEPVWPWLRRELELLLGAERWETTVAEDLTLSSLHIFGLNEEALVRLLEHSLRGYAELFVPWLINVIALRCSEEARRLLHLEDFHATRGQEGQPVVAPSPPSSPESAPISSMVSSGSRPGPAMDELPSTSAAALWGNPREEAHKELAERAAAPSSPSRGRHCLCRGSRCPAKRRASSSQASSPPCKKPPKRRH